jgi:hypothetical protein
VALGDVFQSCGPDSFIMLESFLRPAKIDESVSQTPPGFEVIGIGLGHLLIKLQRLGELPRLSQGPCTVAQIRIQRKICHRIHIRSSEGQDQRVCKPHPPKSAGLFNETVKLNL